MYNYRITTRDAELAAEFRRKPVGHHSPALQRVLNVLRSNPAYGRYVVICTRPGREWVIAELRGRGVAPKRERRRYARLEDAEWEVFKRRWQRATGAALSD